MVSACKAASCSGTGFDRVDYGFDGAGHRTRITTTTAAGTVSVLDIAYAGDIPAQERVNGTVSRTYVADDTGRIVRFCDPDCTGSNPVYVVTWNAHGDALSIGRLDPATGGMTVANRLSYATWGTPTTTVLPGFTDLGFRYLWVGAADVQWDNSAGQALYDMHARTYSPVLGRFLQPDPARADGNLYAYAGNSPVSRIDPTGHENWLLDGVVCLQSQFYMLLACPYSAFYVRFAIDYAIREFGGPDTRHDGKGDACRHCIWQGLVTYSFGAKLARMLGNANEGGNPYLVLDGEDGSTNAQRMDFHNNAIGRRIGQIARSSGGFQYIINTCLQQARIGFLWYLRKNKYLVRGDQYGGLH